MAKIEELEEVIKPCGFYHTKAISIIESAKIIIEKYNGILPSDIEELVKLRGVGRKTANVIRTHIYNIPSIVVDTHVLRTSRLLGLASRDTPIEVEKELEKVLPREHWSRINSQLMTLGRTYCNARKKNCKECFLNKYCKFNNSRKEN